MLSKLNENDPIGFFDSGFGGLTVMREIAKILPHENLIYFADTAHLPYGNKSSDAILNLSIQNSSFLMKLGIKLLIIPCHTACCHALSFLEKTLPIPVMGVIQPGIELIHPFKRIAIFATSATIHSGVYQSLIPTAFPNATLFFKECPLFVPLIEEGFYDHLSLDLIAQSYVGEFKGKIDAALLACTHYPLIQKSLKKALGENIFLLEPAQSCALKVKEYLSHSRLLNHQSKKPNYRFYCSHDPKKFLKLGELFFGHPIEKVEINKNL